MGSANTTTLLGTGVDTQETREEIQFRADGDNASLYMDWPTGSDQELFLIVEGNRVKAWRGEDEEAFDRADVPPVVFAQQYLMNLMDCASEVDPNLPLNGIINGEDGYYSFALDADKLSTVMDLSSFSEVYLALLSLAVDDRGRVAYAVIDLYGVSDGFTTTEQQITTDIDLFEIGFTEVSSIDEFY